MRLLRLASAQADSLYAYEYSTNYPHEIHQNDNDDNTYRSNKSRQPVYRQQQPQIIVYPNIARGNQVRYLQQRMEDEHEEHEWRERERDEQYMQRRLRELERQPRPVLDITKINFIVMIRIGN